MHASVHAPLCFTDRRAQGDSLNAVQVILDRERGRIRTSVACKRLELPVTDLLRVRRQMLERALGVRPLPPLTYEQVEQALTQNER